MTIQKLYILEERGRAEAYSTLELAKEAVGQAAERMVHEDAHDDLLEAWVLEEDATITLYDKATTAPDMWTIMQRLLVR